MLPFSTSVMRMRSSEIRELLSLATQPDIISFAGGMPNPDLFPVKEVDELYAKLSLDEKQTGFQYGPTTGYPPLIEQLKTYLKGKGLPVEGNELMITTGSLQALNLIGKILIDPGDRVITEDPCFIGGVAAFLSYQADIYSIPLDDRGMVIAALDNILDQTPTPKLLYVTPNFHNPAGIIYSRDRREAILERLYGREILLLEDDPYNELYFDSETHDLTQPMVTLTSRSLPYCYTGSFSKIFGPGMRLGWMLAPPEIIEKCSLAKQSMDACSPMFTQILANAFMAEGKLAPYLDFIRSAYARRATLMLDGLREHMPESVHWNTPRGGFYIWVELPEHLDATNVLKAAIAKGTVFVIGKAFDPHGQRNDRLRLSFSHTPEDKISEGVRLVAEAIREAF